MERLNYFNPYKSKSEYHEDRLTRSFLVLLKSSPSCYYFFYESILEKCSEKKIPSLRSQINDDIQFRTQVQNIQFDTEKLLSVLITDEELKPNNKIVAIDRVATYDGIISRKYCGPELYNTIFSLCLLLRLNQRVNLILRCIVQKW